MRHVYIDRLSLTYSGADIYGAVPSAFSTTASKLLKRAVNYSTVAHYMQITYISPPLGARADYSLMAFSRSQLNLRNIFLSPHLRSRLVITSTTSGPMTTNLILYRL